MRKRERLDVQYAFAHSAWERRRLRSWLVVNHPDAPKYAGEAAGIAFQQLDYVYDPETWRAARLLLETKRAMADGDKRRID